MNNTEKAIADYSRALTLNPGCSKCLGNLGIIETEMHNYTDALRHLEQYINLEPGKAMGYIKRGELKFQTGKYDEALADMDKAAQIDVNSPYIFLWKSMTKLAQGNAKDALADINQSIQLKPEVEYAYYVRGKIYIELGKDAEAWKDLSACLQKNPSMNEYHTYAGIALYHLHDYKKALAAFNQSISLDPESYLPYFHRSHLLYDMGRFDSACTDKLKVKELLAKEGDPSALRKIQDEIDNTCNTVRVCIILIGAGLYK